MTLVIACYTPTGIAISADSRTTGMRDEQLQPQGGAPDAPAITVRVPWVISDSARKVFCVQERFAVATWGEAFINGLPTAHHLNDFILATAKQPYIKTGDLADALIQHFSKLAPSAALGFAVGGYDGVEPFVFEIGIASNLKKRWNVDASGNGVGYGAFYGGDWDIVGRIIGNQAPIVWQFMNLQDAVDITRHLIRTTIDQMKFEARVPTVGGPIETITATPTRARFLIRKELHV